MIGLRLKSLRWDLSLHMWAAQTSAARMAAVTSARAAVEFVTATEAAGAVLLELYQKFPGMGGWDDSR